MTVIFLGCAIVGGTVLACQFFLSLLGLGHDADLGDVGGHDVPHDFSHDLAAHDAHGGDAHNHGDAQQHQSSWLAGILTIRTLTAAVTFFGIAGMAADTAGLVLHQQLLLAVACGLAAMCLVHWLMRFVYRFGEDHTVRINRAVGLEAKVYVPIPGEKAGAGKIHVTLQGRLMEYEAVTAQAANLPAGARVVVTGVVGSEALEVAPVPEQAATNA